MAETPHEDLADQESLGKENRVDKKRRGANVAKKIRLTLTEEDDCPVTIFQSKMRERSIKDVDINDIVREALAQIPVSWWDEKIEDLTPLEWKVRQALEDPQMRKKLSNILDSEKTPKESEQTDLQ